MRSGRNLLAKGLQTEPDRPPRVVIVDDREPDRHDLRHALERGGIVVAGTRAALAVATGPVVMLVAPTAVAGVVADPSARVLVLAGGDPGYGLDDALRAPATGPVQAAVTQPAAMSSFSATAGEPSARW